MDDIVTYRYSRGIRRQYQVPPRSILRDACDIFAIPSLRYAADSYARKQDERNRTETPEESPISQGHHSFLTRIFNYFSRKI